MIRSNHQLNYYQAQAILDGRSPPTREDDLNDVAETGNVRKDLEVVANFSRVMNAERTKFGAVVRLFLYLSYGQLYVLTGYKCFVYYRSRAGVGEGVSDERGAVRGVGGCVPAGGCAAAARECRLGLRCCH